jgi:hypothetical protein
MHFSASTTISKIQVPKFEQRPKQQRDMSLANTNNCVVGSSIVLIPYKSTHIAKRAQWMQKKENR